MKKIKFGIAIFILLLINICGSVAQTFDVDTLSYQGNTGQFINVVILGDGYTSAQINTFITDANSFKNYFFNKAPFSNYKNYFNVFIVKTPSNESGVKHPRTASDCPPVATHPQSNPDNYFGSTFDAYGIHRLVVPMNTAAISSVLSNNFPNYDQVFILANSTFYGGSGGAYATATLNSSSGEIAVHEIGHSFANLADEYWAGAQYAAEKPNMTQNNDPLTIKWKNWLTTGTDIGIYQFPGQPWYKPANGNCEMEVLDKQFCNVCSETIIERIHQLVNPIKSYSPVSSSVNITSSLYFSLRLIKPIPNTLKTEWILNGNTIQTNSDSVLINPVSLNTGSNSLSVKLLDTTLLTRSSTHSTTHLYTTNWAIEKTTVGIQSVSSSNEHLIIRLFPNPASHLLNILFKTDTPADIKINIVAANGRIMEKMNRKKWLSTENAATVDLSNYPVGIYFVEFKTSGFTHMEKFIKE
jgi:hypothetical protein